MKLRQKQFWIIPAFLQLLCVEAKLSTEGISSASRLVLLDVDNTLYRDRDAGIESQIVHATHSYCQHVLGIDKERADQLYKEFGSTVEGLQRTAWKDLSNNELQKRLDDFYRTVYDNVDTSSLLLPAIDACGSSTGYSHASKEESKLTRQLLKFSPLPIAFASNSPSWHVYKILRALGLEKLSKNCKGYTPDRLLMYPTKNQPNSFFNNTGENENKSDLSKYRSISFLDDSLYNLNRVKETIPLVDRVHHINRGHTYDCTEGSSSDYGEDNLIQALLQDFRLIEPTFRLSQTRYLESKNQVDRRSIHTETWNKVVRELRETLIDERCEILTGAECDYSDLWIVDLGAGLLSMLDLLLHGDHELGLSALIPTSDLSPMNATTKKVHYTAYESNKELYKSTHDRLLSWGFNVVEKDTSNQDMTTDIIDYQKKHNGVRLRVKVVLESFARVNKVELIGIPERMSPNLIIGCCFADLMDPEQLVPDLLRSFSLLNTTSDSLRRNSLIYFPITFTGTTQFLPPQPFEFQSNGKTIPSDTVGFQSYSRALETVLGHNLNINLLQDVMEDYGAKLIDFGVSDWKIDPERDSYLYETMLYFFGSTGGPQLLKEGWDAPGWIQRAHNKRNEIQVSNRDLLFRIEPYDKINDDKNSNEQLNKKNHMSTILFTAPSQVTSVQRPLPSQLGPRQVLVRASHSLISSGTELKIFKGHFDDDVALDVNIKDMESERMAYPLSYGYALVGVVVDCGSELSRENYLGKTIFTFSPHATHVVTDVDAVQVVPDGIDPKDAIFMPSIETALSLVHDANVRIGENVAVYGQGLIGLLVTALLSRGKGDIPSGRFDSITTFDMIPDRLAASSKMGASQALIPGNNADGLQFDVSIEVSGNARALQSAIDNILNGGRVIVGSWYGNKDVSLKLGIDFHRSHKTIQTSQVSEIPANLSKLWTKQRRFAYTWDLVKQLQPSRLLTKIVPLESAQDAFEALDNGTEIAVAFHYLK